MTDDDFKKSLESGIQNSIDNNPHIREKMLIYLTHYRECKEKNIQPASAVHVTKILKQAFPDKWTPGRTTIQAWLEKNNDK